ncbi:putative gustatory receptor 28a [Monomorium pharaonis]|uniref:putative gustatory receptor 28a n=1 Tax=Monomorium pharaonis TaxID=307658 RepID=UPI00063F8A70|nr:putative gustatory receptor 28a [Monomorium pharaonis]
MSSTKSKGCVKYRTWNKWQLFQATDFQSLMYPSFIFSSIFGLFPYKINGTTFEISKLRYIVSTVILVILCIYEFAVLYEIDIAGTIRFKNTPKTLERNCFYILGNFIAVVTYISCRSRMHLLQTIMNVSSKLSPNSYRKLSRLIHAKDTFGFIYLLINSIFYYITLDFDTWHKAFVPYLNFLVFHMDMLYMNCVCILKACFKRIDDNLINLRELVVNDEPHLLRRIYHENKNPFLLMELKTLKKQHLEISDTVQMLNNIFSLQLLATIVMTFAELTFQLYFYILYLKIGMITINISGQIYEIYIIITMIYYSIKIILLVWACDTGKDQAMKIGTTVHDLLNNTSDEQIMDELQLFSLQILHRENAFSAKGLIMDATLLTAIVGNITTYLLILIQFLIASRSCSEKKASNVTLTN